MRSERSILSRGPTIRILIVPQEFKGTLTAIEAADTIADALARAYPGWQLDRLPMADGGPGTAATLLAALSGESRQTPAHDPLLRPIIAGWAVLSSSVAVIDVAAASGLVRLRPSELDPRRASTYGTGELVVAALAKGCREVILGLGGSGTNDGGAGFAQALGFRLLDASGHDLPPGGAALARLNHIDTSSANPAVKDTRFLGAYDVANPLCGPNGASAVYGPQKGADAATVAELDAALAHFADVIRAQLGAEVSDVPGAGSAGGLGAAAIALVGAALRPGAALVAEAVGLKRRIGHADLILTGEGRLDAQTAFGKGPHYVARLARAAGRPVICLTGSLGPGHESLTGLFDHVEVLSPAASPLPSPAEAAAQLAAAALRAVSALRVARRQVGRSG